MYSSLSSKRPCQVLLLLACVTSLTASASVSSIIRRGSLKCNHFPNTTGSSEVCRDSAHVCQLTMRKGAVMFAGCADSGFCESSSPLMSDLTFICCETDLCNVNTLHQRSVESKGTKLSTTAPPDTSPTWTASGGKRSAVESKSTELSTTAPPDTSQTPTASGGKPTAFTCDRSVFIFLLFCTILVCS